MRYVLLFLPTAAMQVKQQELEQPQWIMRQKKAVAWIPDDCGADCQNNPEKPSQAFT